MPNSKFSHESNRERVCLLCLHKAIPKTNTPKTRLTNVINDKLQLLIEQFALPSYGKYCDFPSLPKVICETCRSKLRKRENGKEQSITVPKLEKFLDFEMSEAALSRTDCDCIVCKVGHVSGRQKIDVTEYTQILASNNKNEESICSSCYKIRNTSEHKCSSKEESLTNLQHSMPQKLQEQLTA